ncbi:MAG: response regulator transcription factor [Anderseniella sp.]
MAPTENNASNTPGNFPRRVLVIDDDPVLRTVIRQFFESQGSVKVDEAGNGWDAQGLIASASVPYDLTTLDLSMPEVDGFEFLNHLKQHSIEMRILIISSLPATVIRMAETLADFETLNAIGHLKKPLSASALNAILKAQNWQVHDDANHLQLVRA